MAKMLYLDRKIGQSIIINNNIEVKIVKITKGAVKIGLTYPNLVTVLRKEIFDKVALENKQALKSFDEYEIEKIEIIT